MASDSDVLTLIPTDLQMAANLSVHTNKVFSIQGECHLALLPATAEVINLSKRQKDLGVPQTVSYHCLTISLVEVSGSPTLLSNRLGKAMPPFPK